MTNGTSTTEVDVLRTAVLRDVGTDMTRWHVAAGYRGLALCILDSIYSTGKHYSGVLNALGSYRRALSSYEVKVGAVPVLGQAVDEPSAYELLDGELNRAQPRELA